MAVKESAPVLAKIRKAIRVTDLKGGEVEPGCPVLPTAVRNGVLQQMRLLAPVQTVRQMGDHELQEPLSRKGFARTRLFSLLPPVR
jgi:hypothetical protein